MTRHRSEQPASDSYVAARDTCYRLLATRQRSGQELRDALARKGVDEQAAEEVLGRFERAGLVDDAAFAREWTRARVAQRGLSRAAVRVELQRKGVATELISEAVDEVDDDSEQERARELVRKKLRGTDRGATQAERAKLQRRLVGALARKGYSSELAYRVVHEQLQGSDESTDSVGPLD